MGTRVVDHVVDHNRFRELREAKLLRQADLAAAAEVSVRTVAYLEAGGHSATGIVLNKLARVLEVPVASLLLPKLPAQHGPLDRLSA